MEERILTVLLLERKKKREKLVRGEREKILCDTEVVLDPFLSSSSPIWET